MPFAVTWRSLTELRDEPACASAAVPWPAMAALRRAVVPLALVLVVAACTAADPGTATTTASPTTTTIAVAIRSTAPSPVVVGEGVDDGAAAALAAEIERLRPVAESLRGLGFIGAPQIAILTPEAFSGRWAMSLDASLDAPALAVESRLMRLMGLVGPGDDLRAIIIRNVPEPLAAFYDAGAGELVVSASGPGLDGARQAEIVRHLVLMLTDQYHDHARRVAELRERGETDQANALAALAVADALYAELRFIDTLSGEEQHAVASAGVPVVSGPRFVVHELAFAGDAGVPFVARLLETGGTAELDRAYGVGLTTESILHPMRFMAGEGVLELGTTDVAVDGYTLQHAGSRGELGLRSLLGSATIPGVLTQTADGWGADHEVLLSSVDDVAFGYVFRGDSADDAVEVAQAFLDHATFVMGMNEGLASGGGVEFVGVSAGEDGDDGATEEAPVAGPYVFVDRAGDVLVVVIASDITAGRELRSQLGR